MKNIKGTVICRRLLRQRIKGTRLGSTEGKSRAITLRIIILRSLVQNCGTRYRKSGAAEKRNAILALVEQPNTRTAIL